MTGKNTETPMYLVPGRLTDEQKLALQKHVDAYDFDKVLEVIGTPIQPCGDVKTVCREHVTGTDEIRPGVSSLVFRQGAELVRRTDMEAQVAACKADIVLASYDYHTADIGSPDGPPCARFDLMFDEGDSIEVHQRVLRYLGIESRVVEDEWEDSIEGFGLDRKTVEALPVPDFVPCSQWKLASACDTEDGTILRQYVRPVAAEKGGEA